MTQSLILAKLDSILPCFRLSYYGKYVIMLLTMFQTLFQVFFMFSCIIHRKHKTVRCDSKTIKSFRKFEIVAAANMY